MQENFEFDLVTEYDQYISSRDKTNVVPTALIQNSKNIYKSLNGTIVNREGIKTRGAINSTASGVVSSFEFECQAGIRPIRVTANGTLSAEFDANDGNGPIWYDLLTSLTLTRFIFSGEFFDTVQLKNILLAVNGSVRTIYEWEGGMSKISGSTAAVPGVITQGNTDSTFATRGGFTLGSGGSGYVIGDVLTLVGGDNTAQVTVSAVSGGVITHLAVYLVPQGTGYTAGTVATTGGHGTGATVVINSVYTAGTITKSNLNKTFFQDGFSKGEDFTKWQFVYNGVTYAYEGGQDSTTLTGVTPDPSGIPAGAVIASSFIPYTGIPISDSLSQYSLAQYYTCDFLEVINNQLYIGSYNSPLIFVSSNSNYADFNTVTNGGVGTPFTFALDTNAVGISQKNYIPIIFGGTSDLYQINISSQNIQLTQGIDTTIQVVGLTKISFALNEAPIAQEFIDSNGEYIVWIGQDNQLHVFGAMKDVFLSNKAPILSIPVENELKDINFTGGALRFIGQYIFITAPVLGIHYFYRHREYVDQNAVQRTKIEWMPPQVSQISRFANINGVIYGHSNLNPMIYQIFDTNQWHDDSPSGSLPYECVMAVAYRHAVQKGGSTRRQGKLRFDKVYVEGYLDRGTPLYGNVLFDYQGSSGIQTIQVNTLEKPARLFSYTSAPPLGKDTLADNPIGDGLNPSTDLHEYVPKFRSIRTVKSVNCYEYAIEIYSYDIDARWEIIAMGVNMELAPESPRDLLA